MKSLTGLILFSGALLAQASAQTLHIYAIDVEGGKSTLYVSPLGESMLVDTGYAAIIIAMRIASPLRRPVRV